MEVLHYTAFSHDPAGGNPAGVVLDAAGLDDATMLAVAAEVGYSESAFLVEQGGGRFAVRYFSPLAEVPFCGHATIASAVAYAERHGPGSMLYATQAGEVAVETSTDSGRPDHRDADQRRAAGRTPRPGRPGPAAGRAALAAGRARPRRCRSGSAYAGAWHPVVAVRDRSRLADLDYDFDALGRLMAERDWTTVALVWRAGPDRFDVRNPFPPGGVVEDPATGAAAAALGGYLRELGLVEVPATLTLRQGEDMGRPSLLTVTVPAAPGSGIGVSGTAVRM